MGVTAISSITSSDGSLTHPRYATWKGIIPAPPESLLWSVGGASLELFLVLGEAWAQFVTRYTPPDATVIDIGCGCGRTARVLINNPYIRRYIGFDVIPANIEWCNNFVAPSFEGRAEFHHYDLYSREYNPNGALQTSQFVFPCGTGSADVIFAASVFTHLLEPDATRYLREISRTLSGRGHAILSVHNQVSRGERYRGNETRIDVDPAYFIELAEMAGLAHAGGLDDLGGQQVLIFRKAA